MRNLLSLERKKRELQPVQKFDPSLVSTKFRKSGSAYPIHLIPKKKKETFDFKSLTTRPPLTDAYPVAEKFPTKGKKHQKQSESVCFELKSLNLHNLLTIRVHYLRRYRMTIHSSYQILPEKECHVQKFHHSSIFDETDREFRIASIRKSIDSRNCVSSYRKIYVPKKKKRKKLTLKKYMDYHIEKASKILSNFISLPATRVYPIHPADRYLGTGAHGGSILTYFPV